MTNLTKQVAYSFMKKILILTAQFGSGHLTAAKAIEEGFSKTGKGDFEIEIVDLVSTLQSILTKTMSKAYKNLVRFTPKIYKIFYNQSDRKTIMRFLNKISRPFLHDRLEEIFEKANPDIVISTYPLWNYLIKTICDKCQCSFRKKVRFITVVTDSLYEDTGSGGWLFEKGDIYIVPNEDTAAFLKSQKIPREKIKIFGFPIKQNEEEGVSTKEFKQSLGFDPDKKLFTVIFHTGVNFLKAKRFLKKLDGLERKDFEILVITGKNASLKEDLEEKSWLHNCRITGWIDNIFPYLKAADIVFTKAGGAITTECVAANKPMIITQVIPGQEEANVRFIEKHGFGFAISENGINLTQAINLILSDYQRIQKNIKKIAKLNANVRIAGYANSLLR